MNNELINTTLEQPDKLITGLDVKVNRLVGIYTKYFDEYPSGDCSNHSNKLQPKVGSLNTEEEETLELKFFPLDKVPALVNKQHEDSLKDYLNDREIFIR